MSRTTISDMTGFDGGDEYETDEEVDDYFTVDNIIEMFGKGHLQSFIDEDTLRQLVQERLDEMAQEVKDNRWHMVEVVE